MTAKAQICSMLDSIPNNEMTILLEVVRRFVPTDADDIATADDLEACRVAMREYETGKAIPHDAIDWG